MLNGHEMSDCKEGNKTELICKKKLICKQKDKDKSQPMDLQI